MTRVGVIGEAWEDAFAFNIMAGLRTLGAEVVELGTSYTYSPNRLVREARYVLNRFPQVAQRQQDKLIDRIREAGDLDLVITTESGLLPTTVGRIRADLGVPIVLWFPDHVGQMVQHMMLACGYNAVYLKDPLLVQRLRAMIEVPVEYLPEACNPDLHRPLVPYGTDRGLVSPGNMYPVRVRLLERLTTDEVPVRVYGKPFPPWMPDRGTMRLHQDRLVWGQEKAKVMRAATGVLNNLHIGEMHSVNCRLFDAAGSGAAVLCEYRPALDDLFDVGSEVLTFSTYDELFKHYRWLTEHPDEAAAMGDAASERAHAEHTHAHRLRRVLETSVV